MKFAIFNGDIASVIADGTFGAGIEIPAALTSHGHDRLRLLDGIVRDVADFDQFYVDANGTKHVVPGAGWQSVACDWDARLIADGGVWRVATSLDGLIDYAKFKRWQKHTGGTIIGGVPILTDADSKVMITGARVAAAADPDWTTIWDGADGGSYPITAAQMIAISDGVQAFVNACFATYAAVKAEIDAGTITTIAEIDAAYALIDA